LPPGGFPAPATASGSTAPPGDPTARPAPPRPLPPAPARPSFIPPAPIPSAPPASAPPEVKIEPPGPAEPQPAPARPTPPPSAQKKVDDPFSVEEIEAEFARLLGRTSTDKGGPERP